MKRGGMLYCADVDAQRYKVLNARGQTAFTEATDDEPLGGTAFTLDHAFRLRLLQDLIGGESDDERYLGGLSVSFASFIVGNVMLRFEQHPLTHTGPRDCWAGVAVFEEETDKGDRDRFSDFFVGEIEQLSIWMQNASQRSTPEGGSLELVRVVIANASRAARFVRSRAEELGLPEAQGFYNAQVDQ